MLRWWMMPENILWIISHVLTPCRRRGSTTRRATRYFHWSVPTSPSCLPTDISSLRHSRLRHQTALLISMVSCISRLILIRRRAYPIIDYVYPGPQVEATNYPFTRMSVRTDRLAQAGFVVITVGNRGGHPNRSKWYHNYGYGNLRDYGLADQKTAIEQLAARHKYIGRQQGGYPRTFRWRLHVDSCDTPVS